jgi:hypothetical protein
MHHFASTQQLSNTTTVPSDVSGNQGKKTSAASI